MSTNVQVAKTLPLAKSGVGRKAAPISGAQAWARQQAKLRAMQSKHAGRGLLSRLLADRAKERVGVTDYKT